MRGGWGGRFSYTYSVLKDNYVGETNFYTAVSPGLPVNNYNYVASRRRAPAASSSRPPATTRPRNTRYSVLDVPHRVILAPIVELPFGTGRKWANSSKAWPTADRRLDGVLGRSTCRAASRSTCSRRPTRG